MDRRDDEQPDVSLRVLGALEVHRSGEPVPIGHARQRSVLAVLAVDANRVVPVDSLLNRVWGDHAPSRARSALRTYLSRLRYALVPTGVTITHRDSGYLLSARPDSIDLHRFRRLLSSARTAGSPEHALVLIDEALALWRGEPLAELNTGWADTMRERLRHERFAAESDQIDWRLQVGEHRALLPELAVRAAAHPLDERLVGQLMLALYRDGRQADALERYERTRLTLADELGADPAPPLRELHQRIIATDPALTSRPPRAATAPVLVPRQLPPAPPCFIGRTSELATLTASLDGLGQGRVVAISAIAGAEGVGKTWLALNWAHAHAGRFPDGQLFVDLHGSSPSAAPMDPSTAVRGFLDALGVEASAIPSDPQAQVGLYRSLVADKRMLVLVDNAHSADQVVPLLPGSATCAVIVTSRNCLTDLLNRHGANPIRMDVLNAAEAHQLLTERLGVRRVAAEPDAVRELLTSCGGVPLALVSVAGQATANPDLPLAALAAEFRDTATRLDALHDDNPAAGDSWLKLVEHWFVEPARRKPRRFADRPATGFEAVVHRWIDEWNADQVLGTLAEYCAQINDD
ncbi:BTAD domain-containing putative transcriptional regulator [Actinosynnema sp. NPDC050436]|uniref:AfsR/SARP family transcriptional regulator n=1 Tax=Actinosynnema sp. NPDC050436 TaxID=3155659 RepID=UPI0033EA8DE7